MIISLNKSQITQISSVLKFIQVNDRTTVFINNSCFVVHNKIPVESYFLNQLDNKVKLDINNWISMPAGTFLDLIKLQYGSNDLEIRANKTSLKLEISCSNKKLSLNDYNTNNKPLLDFDLFVKNPVEDPLFDESILSKLVPHLKNETKDTKTNVFKYVYLNSTNIYSISLLSLLISNVKLDIIVKLALPFFVINIMQSMKTLKCYLEKDKFVIKNTDTLFILDKKIVEDHKFFDQLLNLEKIINTQIKFCSFELDVAKTEEIWSSFTRTFNACEFENSFVGDKLHSKGSHTLGGTNTKTNKKLSNVETELEISSGEVFNKHTYTLSTSEINKLLNLVKGYSLIKCEWSNDASKQWALFGLGNDLVLATKTKMA